MCICRRTAVERRLGAMSEVSYERQNAELIVAISSGYQMLQPVDITR